MTFVLSDKQIEKLAKWKPTLPKPPLTAIGGEFTYSFIPTGIGMVIRVKNWDGREIDLTDYDEW